MGRRGLALALTGVVGCAAAAGVYFTMNKGGKATPGAVASAGGGETKPAESTPAQLTEGLRRADTNALATLWQRLNEPKDAVKTALTEESAREWVEILGSVRHGYNKIEGSVARTTAVVAAGRILDKFAVEPGPAGWLPALMPTRDILLSGAVDADPMVRSASLGELSKMWSWTPARTPMPLEEKALDEWRDSLTAPVVRRLGDPDPKVRMAAVACLSMNPIDSQAAPAVAYVDDSRSGDVRQQVLVSFSRRPTLLTDEMVLKRMHDVEPGIPTLAEIILKARGLTKDQIFLGKLITSPKPELRASVIPMLQDRKDIDPVVWFVQLSHDADETVRAQAVQALGERDSPEARTRLREMTRDDASAAVRDAAGKVYNKLTTAALPPLPGSPRLNPKAN